MAGLLMVFTLQMLVVPNAGEERGNENDASTYENSDVKFSHAVFPPVQAFQSSTGVVSLLLCMFASLLSLTR